MIYNVEFIDGAPDHKVIIRTTFSDIANNVKLDKATIDSVLEAITQELRSWIENPPRLGEDE